MGLQLKRRLNYESVEVGKKDLWSGYMPEGAHVWRNGLTLFGSSAWKLINIMGILRNVHFVKASYCRRCRVLKEIYTRVL